MFCWYVFLLTSTIISYSCHCFHVTSGYILIIDENVKSFGTYIKKKDIMNPNMQMGSRVLGTVRICWSWFDDSNCQRGCSCQRCNPPNWVQNLSQNSLRLQHGCFRAVFLISSKTSISYTFPGTSPACYKIISN